jgi:small subunit ribosomal protein S6
MSKRGGDFVNKYEVMFIAKPLEEAEVDPIVEFISNLITKNGGNIEKVDRWGKRHLAYLVQKQAEGYYVLINFEADPTVIKEIDRVIKIRDEILRHLIVKIDE